MLSKLSSLLKDVGILPTDRQKNQLIAYVNMLYKWSKAYNSAPVRDPSEMLVRHILDNIVMAPYLQGEWFVDVGTGSGLPSILLSVMRPEAHFMLLGSPGKRARSLRQMQHGLKLENIESAWGRVEEFPPELPFGDVISRAFASLNDTVSWYHHLPGKQGRFYAPKGQMPEDEIALLSEEYQVESVVKLQVPTLGGKHHPVVIRANKI